MNRQRLYTNFNGPPEVMRTVHIGFNDGEASPNCVTINQVVAKGPCGTVTRCALLQMPPSQAVSLAKQLLAVAKRCERMNAANDIAAL